MLKTIILIFSILIILVGAWYFLIHKPGLDASMANNACKTTGGITGTMQNGVCVPPTPKQETLPVKPKFH